MKKEIFIHFSLFFLFFVVVLFTKGFFNLSSWPFWLGGLIGTLLPDLDHLIYVYFLRPQELTSQRVSYMLGKRELVRSLELLASTRSERTKLIFHTAFFQIIFIILSFLIFTSSPSFFGRGLALSFYLHILIDQAVDLREIGNLDAWFRDFPINLDIQKQKVYWWLMAFVALILGFLM